MSTTNRRVADSALVSEHPYSLESITRTEMPADTEGPEWHRYIIIQGENRIVGQRRGCAASVRAAALTLVDQLNERRTVRNGRVGIKLGPRRF